MVVRGGLRLRSGRQLSKDRTVSGTLLLENVRGATNAPSSIATPGINDQAHHVIHVTVARMARFSYVSSGGASSKLACLSTRRIEFRLRLSVGLEASSGCLRDFGGWQRKCVRPLYRRERYVVV